MSYYCTVMLRFRQHETLYCTNAGTAACSTGTERWSNLHEVLDERRGIEIPAYGDVSILGLLLSAALVSQSRRPKPAMLHAAGSELMPRAQARNHSPCMSGRRSLEMLVVIALPLELVADCTVVR